MSKGLTGSMRALALRHRMHNFLHARALLPAVLPNGIKNQKLREMVASFFNVPLHPSKHKADEQILKLLKAETNKFYQGAKRQVEIAKKSFCPGPAFYETREWRALRYQALKLHGGKCQCCGRKPPQVVLHVDHVKPRSKYPEFELDINNLQVLCEDCNLGKSNGDETDWRGRNNNSVGDAIERGLLICTEDMEYPRLSKEAVEALNRRVFNRDKRETLERELIEALKAWGQEPGNDKFRAWYEDVKKHLQALDGYSHSESPGKTGIGETSPVGQRTIN